jgi:hypothetical protein
MFFQSQSLRMDVSSPNLMQNMGTGASGEQAAVSGKGKGKGGKAPGPKNPPAVPKGVVKMEPIDLETWSAIGCESI